MTEYGIGSRDYLQRAKQLLAGADHGALFYAAFELRCGVEARLQEYLDPHAHVPSGNKADWRIPSLGKTAARAFRTGDKVARVLIQDRRTKQMQARLYYTPVSPELQRLAARLGDYLHAAKSRHESNDPWWGNLRTNLEVAVRLLEEATFGTLLGPPLVNRKTGQLHLPLELPEGTVAPSVARGDDVLLDVRYFSALADARGDAA